MRYRPEQKQESRTRLLAAAGRAFRRRGYGGIGVDGLAREAGVTSGAFYAHFSSKDAAFLEVALAGLAQLNDAVVGLQAEHGPDWLTRFIEVYLGHRVDCELGDSCGLQSLTPDVMRADAEVRRHYEGKFAKVVASVAAGLDGPDEGARLAAATALLSLLSGGVTLARSVETTEARGRIVQALRDAALALAQPASAAEVADRVNSSRCIRAAD